MRVLTAAHYWLPHVGGVEFEAREQSRRLVARGHDVTVVSSRIGDDRALSYDDGFPVHKLPASNVLEERVRLPYPLFSPKLFSVMSRLARDVDVVVAHTHTFMSTIAAARAAHAHKIPFAAHVPSVAPRGRSRSCAGFDLANITPDIQIGRNHRED